MSWKGWTLAAVAFGLLTGLAIADRVDVTTQGVYDSYLFYDANGALRVTGSYRAYEHGAADTSLTANGIDFALSSCVPCSSWYATAMRNGNPIRDMRVDLYKIDGADSLIRANVRLDGLKVGARAVDDTSMGTGSVTSRAVLDHDLQAADYDTSSVEGWAISDGAITGPKIGAGEVGVTELDPSLHFVYGDSLVLGHHTPATAGFLYQYNSASKRVGILTSVGMTGHASFYWPIATGTTDGIYQKTAAGAQITLTPSGLTSIGATTGSFTNCNATYFGGSYLRLTAYSDTSSVKSATRFPTLKIGGWGTIGSAIFRRDGFDWTLRPSNLGASGTTEIVHGAASTNNLAYYSVSGSTETITPTADPSVATITASGAITSGNNGAAGSVKVYDGSGNYSTIGAQAMATNPAFNVPVDNGTAGYLLKTDGSGNLAYVKNDPNMIFGSVTFASTGGQRQAFYRSGVTTSYTGGIWYNANVVPYAAGLSVYFKTDSVVVRSSASFVANRTLTYIGIK